MQGTTIILSENHLKTESVKHIKLYDLVALSTSKVSVTEMQ